MTFTRAVLIALLLSCVASLVVGWVSRAPGEIRRPPSVGADEPSEDGFTDAEVNRHAAYRGPLYLAMLLALCVQIAFLLLLRGAPIARVVAWAEGLPGGWATTTAAVVGTVTLAGWIVVLPLSFVRGYLIQRAWHLSTQQPGGWFVDLLKGEAVSLVIAMVAGLAFFGCVRAQPRTWWLWSAAAFTLLTALLVFLYPVVVAPLFNRFTPLDDPGLVARIQQLGREIGVEVDQVLVADASRRSTAENAYVAGLGATKQLVLYDTLLRSGSEEETLFVVAHEMGHQAENHVLKSLLLSAVGLFAGFAALAWLVSRPAFLDWSRASGIGDLRLIPALLVVAIVGGLVTLPFQNAVSRRFERRADQIAFRAIEDPVPAVGAFRRLAIANIADLRPHPFVEWLLYSHPPVGERIRSARTEAGARL